MEKIGERIKRLRNEKHLTALQVAEKCGISENAISMYENGHRSPSVKTARILCDLFNVDMDYLYCESDVRRKVDLTGTYANHVSSEEIAMILAFRNAPENIQQSIKLMLGVQL